MFIRSERLFLRPVWPEDSIEILANIDDIAVARHLAHIPWPYRAEDARAFAALPQDPRFPHFLITRPLGADGVDVIGTIALADVGGEAMLGYWLARRVWGRGLATEAARGVLDLARVLGHQRVLAAHFIDNAVSARVLEKLGFAPTGEVSMAPCPARGGSVATVTRSMWLSAAAAHTPDGSGASDVGRRAA